MHDRHSIRLRNHDYTQGAYFVTLCTHDGAVLFGDIVDGKMYLNDAGRMADAVWRAMPDHYDGIDIDEFVIMPDHMHGIIIMNKGRASNGAGTGARPYMHAGATPRGGPIMKLSDVIHRFKSLTTAKYMTALVNAGKCADDGAGERSRR